MAVKSAETVFHIAGQAGFFRRNRSGTARLASVERDSRSGRLIERGKEGSDGNDRAEAVVTKRRVVEICMASVTTQDK